MYEEFNGLASINASDLDRLIKTNNNQFLSNKRNEATLIKLLMEESNRHSLQREIEKLSISLPKQPFSVASLRFPKRLTS